MSNRINSLHCINKEIYSDKYGTIRIDAMTDYDYLAGCRRFRASVLFSDGQLRESYLTWIVGPNEKTTISSPRRLEEMVAKIIQDYTQESYELSIQ